MRVPALLKPCILLYCILCVAFFQILAALAPAPMALVFRRPAQSAGRPAQKRSSPSLACPAKRECRTPGQAAGGVKYEFWPSDLKRAGHTSVEVEDHEPLGRHLAKLGPNEACGIHLARMQKLPCKLIPSSKFRNGADRLGSPVGTLCPVFLGYGLP